LEVSIMFDNMLHNHTIPTVNAEGHTVSRRATCAEAQSFYGTHTITTLVDDGQGGTRVTRTPASCLDAEAERQALLGINAQQATTIESQAGEIAELKGEVATCRRLMTQSLPIIFKLGPELQSVLAEDVGDPDLTDDGTAVKMEGLQFVLLVQPFDQQVVVHAVDVNIPDRPFPIKDGAVSVDDQTSMIGQINRIKRAHATGVDPVSGAILLTAAAA
jgi:hypothetical protein